MKAKLLLLFLLSSLCGYNQATFVKWKASSCIQYDPAQNTISRGAGTSSPGRLNCNVYSTNYLFNSGDHIEYTIPQSDVLAGINNKKAFGLRSENGEFFVFFIIGSNLKIGTSTNFSYQQLDNSGTVIAANQVLKIRLNGNKVEFYQDGVLLKGLDHAFKPLYKAVAALDPLNSFTGLKGEFADCVPPALTITGNSQPGPNLRTCVNNPVKIVAKGGDEYHIESPGNGYPFITIGFTESYTLDPSVTTTYTLVGHKRTCPDQVTRLPFTITVDPAFSMLINGPTAICEDDEPTLNITTTGGAGTVSYVWAIDPFGEDPDPDCDNCQQTLVFPKMDKTYYATAITEYGCKASDSHAIEVDALPTLSCPSFLSYCKNGSPIPLGCSWQNNETQVWSPATGLNQASFPSFAAPGTTTNYTVQLKNGVCSKTKNVTVQVLEPPRADFDFTSPGLEVTFTANNTGWAVSSYNWSFGDNSSSGSNPVNHLYTAPGNYNVTLTLNSSACPSSTITKTIKVQSNQNCCN